MVMPEMLPSWLISSGLSELAVDAKVDKSETEPTVAASVPGIVRAGLMTWRLRFWKVVLPEGVMLRAVSITWSVPFSDLDKTTTWDWLPAERETGH